MTKDVENKVVLTIGNFIMRCLAGICVGPAKSLVCTWNLKLPDSPNQNDAQHSSLKEERKHFASEK